MRRHCDFLVIEDNRRDPRARYSCRTKCVSQFAFFCALSEPAALIFAVVRDRIYHEKVRMHYARCTVYETI